MSEYKYEIDCSKMVNCGCGPQPFYKPDKECQGCSLNKIERPICVINPVFRGRKCPCQKCIIKMVCLESCKAYKEFGHLQFGEMKLMEEEKQGIIDGY